MNTLITMGNATGTMLITATMAVKKEESLPAPSIFTFLVELCV